MKRFGPVSIPRLAEAGLDIQVLSFTFAVSVLVGLCFGVVPALGVGRFEIGDDLKAGSRTATRRFGIGDFLILSEVAVSAVLLIGAGLLVRSLIRLENANPGFEPTNILTTRKPDNEPGTAANATALIRLIDTSYSDI
jgi:hypothetical protein